jgi:hypothetical protein
MQKMLRWRIGIAVFLVTTAGALGQTKELSTADLQGVWIQVDGSGRVRVQADQLLTDENGKLHIRGIVHVRPGSLVLRNSGELETWQATLGDSSHLTLGHGTEVHAYQKIQSVPAVLEFHPLTLGQAQQLSLERIRAIQQEIMARNEREQKEAGKEGVRALLAENADYLGKLVQEVGWIDSARFGEKASVFATIMAKHTGNLPLMVAILPYVEKELKDTGDGQTYAVLYDAVQLDLGKRQRYGTQIGTDAKGNPYILPLEDPAKVDDYLKAIGVPPLSKYMADASKILFDGRPIRLATPEESE